MSVDHIPCSNCNEVFCDCGPFVCCEDCGEYLCPACMEELGIWESMAAEKDDEFDQCPFCSKQCITTLDLMVWALRKLDLTRKQAEEQMRGDK